jgi:hypothetical protein
MREQVEKTVVWYVFFGRVTRAPSEEHGETDQGKGNRKEDDAAPIEVRVAPPFAVLLGITIWLSHGKCYARKKRSAKNIMKPEPLQKSRTRAVSLRRLPLGPILAAAI